MNRIQNWRLATLFLAALTGMSSSAQIDPSLASQLQQVLNDHVQNQGNNGVSACLIMPNGELWTGTAGVGVNNLPITDSTVFYGASTTKADNATSFHALKLESF